MKDQILEILKKELPKTFNIIVKEYQTCFGDHNIKIAFSPNAFEVNNVKGQFPQLVSLDLCLDDLDIHSQVFGCMGGQCIYKIPNIHDDREKYLCMKSIKIPFRRPKKQKENVLKAIEKFAQNYLKLMKENKDDLFYQDVIDYSFLNEAEV